ncbi:hypothetical protein GGH94_001796 [Coemansia aciculifera]|uniref:Uncharacterized protein n=1 Tax=Coemansia aciculifera TaxID=417176 RepID=A0A9W8IRZ6_9FUNG|nr:hypothetical protein GGH94_001796 [Coemansia aciculifera]KAJ2875679.1 hypothetical protein GGH93_001418 [Coemansia aciculifera]
MTADYACGGGHHSASENSDGIRGYVSSGNDSDGEDDNDYVYMTSITGDSSDDGDSSEGSEGGRELVSETAALVGEILSGGTQPPDSNEAALASSMESIAHSIYGTGSAMTCAMYARHMA